MATRGAQQAVYKILAIQMAVTLIIAIAALALADVRAAYSAMIGGGINMLATGYFARRVFSAGPGSSAKIIARTFYWGEVVKIILTVILFTGVLLWLDLAYLPLFLAYALTMLAFWLALLFTL